MFFKKIQEHRNPGVSRNSSADELSIDNLGYNSISGQIREAVDESQSLIEFLGKAWSIITNTAAFTILAGVHAFIPLGMMMIGVKHLEDCPKQPNLPIYLFVGGCVGLLKNVMVLLSLIRKRRSELEVAAESSGKDVQSPVSASRATFYSGLIISAFLLGWFAYGNYLTWSIFEPKYKMPLQNPKNWCSKTAYYFALVHFFIVYGMAGLYVITMIILVICHRCMMSTWRDTDF